MSQNETKQKMPMTIAEMEEEMKKREEKHKADMKKKEDAYKAQKAAWQKKIREAKTREAKAAKQQRDNELIALGLKYEAMVTNGDKAGVDIQQFEVMRAQWNAMMSFLKKDRYRKSDNKKFQYWENFISEYPDAFPGNGDQ